MPWLIHGENTVSDSTFIIDYLVNTYASNSNGNNSKIGRIRVQLTAEEAAKHTAIQRLLEDSLFPLMPYSRFVDKDGEEFEVEFFLKSIPTFLRPLIIRPLQSMQYWNFHAIGIARFSNDEKLLIHKKNVDALEVLLGDKPYFGGDDPAIIDCCAFAMLENFVNFPIKYLGLREYIESKRGLASYVERLRKEFFSE